MSHVNPTEKEYLQNDLISMACENKIKWNNTAWRQIHFSQNNTKNNLKQDWPQN